MVYITCDKVTLKHSFLRMIGPPNGKFIVNRNFTYSLGGLTRIHWPSASIFRAAFLLRRFFEDFLVAK